MHATIQTTEPQAKILLLEEPGHFGYMSIHGSRSPRGGDVYRYETITPGNVRVYKMHADKVDHVVEQYDVSSHPGRMQCECGDHVYRGRECKHIAAAIELGLIARVEVDNTPPTPEEVAAELLAAETEGASLIVMMTAVRHNFSPAFGDRVCEIITRHRQDEDDAACPDDDQSDDADIDWGDDVAWQLATVE